MNAGRAPLFDVVAVAANGAVQSRRVAAPSEQQATQQLQLANLRVLSCRPAPAPRWALATLLPRRRARLQISLFTEELAALLDAGLGMVDAIRTLALKERDESARRAIERVATDLTEGLPLSQALTNQPDTFPALLIAHGRRQRADRRSGVGAATLRRAPGDAVRAAQQGGGSRDLSGAAADGRRPGRAVPARRRRAAVRAAARRCAPGPAARRPASCSSWGKAIAAHPWMFVGALVAAGALLVSQVLRAMRNGWQIPGLQRLWIVGPLVRMFRHAQFFRTSAMLVQGGIPALRAFCDVPPAADARGPARAGPAATEISEGKRIGPALAAVQIADPVALRMLEVAQRTGRLAEVLARIAQFQEAQLARAVTVASRLIEPALMIFIGLVIGGIVVLMYLPIFDLASSLQ